jgi:hypothetical protein
VDDADRLVTQRASSGTGSAPLTVWTSEVQISAAVVFDDRFLRPGVGMGFSITSVRPTS